MIAHETRDAHRFRFAQWIRAGIDGELGPSMRKVAIEIGSTNRIFAELSIEVVVDRFDGDFMGGAFAFVFIGDAQDARIDCINEMRCRFARGRNAAHGDALTLAGEVKWWIFVERSIAIVVDLSCVGGARNSLRDRPRARIGICLWNRVNTHGIK